MKRVLLFIGLKVAEIVGVVFGPYYIGLFVTTKWPEFWTNAPVWFAGALLVLVGAGLFVIGVFSCGVISVLIEANWEWAGKILEKK